MPCRNPSAFHFARDWISSISSAMFGQSSALEQALV
jgi:hypothetical protein